jgi:protein TonB
MASGISARIGLIATAALAASCASLVPPPAQEPDREARVSDTPAPTCKRNAPGTIDSYKIGAARHILRSNLGHTFDGHLPPMLPAIVVLRLSVDHAGKLTDVSVQRTRDETATEAAVASVRRSGNFPLPADSSFARTAR